MFGWQIRPGKSVFGRGYLDIGKEGWDGAGGSVAVVSSEAVQYLTQLW